MEHDNEGAYLVDALSRDFLFLELLEVGWLVRARPICCTGMAGGESLNLAGVDDGHEFRSRFSEDGPIVDPGWREQDMQSVHLVSQEGESFDVRASVAKMSNLVKTMIDGGWEYHARIHGLPSSARGRPLGACGWMRHDTLT